MHSTTYTKIIAGMQTETVMVGHHRATPAWHDPGRPVVDAFARVYYIIAGAAEVVQGGRRIALRPGHLFMIPGFQPFRYRCPLRMEQYYLHINIKLFGGVDAPAYLGWPNEAPVRRRAAMRRHWLTMLELWRTPSPAACLRLDGLARELLAAFMPAAADAGARARRRAMSRLTPALAYMDAHAAEKLTLPELARRASLQPNYFSNLFTATFGVPPMRYLTILRVQMAQAILLKESGVKLREVAERTGFHDEFHCSRMFKRETGMPPSKFAAGGPRP